MATFTCNRCGNTVEDSRTRGVTYCRKCGNAINIEQNLSAGSTFANTSGFAGTTGTSSALPQSSMQNNSNSVLKANRKYEGQPCNICGQNIQLGDLIHVCSNCQSVNHEDCWNKHGGCTGISCQNNKPSYSRPTMNSSTRFPSLSNNMNGGNTGSLPSNMVPCRWCKEPIVRGAKKCKYCNEFQSDSDREKAMKSETQYQDGSLGATDWIGILCCPMIALIQAGIYYSRGQTAKGKNLALFSIISIIIGILSRIAVNSKY